MTITEFLTARLDEDEAFARAAVEIGHIHTRLDDEQYSTSLTWRWGLLATGIVDGREAGYGTSYHDGAPSPEFVLADIAAKRAIVEEFEQVHADYQVHHTPTLEGQRFGLMKAVSMLTQPYAGHPDFDPEWSVR